MPIQSISVHERSTGAGEVATPAPAGAVPEGERVLSWGSTAALILFLTLMTGFTMYRLLAGSRRRRASRTVR